jgi:hypothetical protein
MHLAPNIAPVPRGAREEESEPWKVASIQRGRNEGRNEKYGKWLLYRGEGMKEEMKVWEMASIQKGRNEGRNEKYGKWLRYRGEGTKEEMKCMENGFDTEGKE